MSNFICFPTPPSCNDLKLGKFFSGKTDFEPSLPFVTVLQSILYSIINQELFQETDTVFVSNLLRSWITAFLFFSSGKRENTNILNLCLSPYLRENNNNRGNFPKEIKHSIYKFLHFI
jgi:hypothetical protein